MYMYIQCFASVIPTSLRQIWLYQDKSNYLHALVLSLIQYYWAQFSRERAFCVSSYDISYNMVRSCHLRIFVCVSYKPGLPSHRSRMVCPSQSCQVVLPVRESWILFNAFKPLNFINITLLGFSLVHTQKPFENLAPCSQQRETCVGQVDSVI